MVWLVSLAKIRVIKPVVSGRFKLDQSTEAPTKLKECKIRSKEANQPLSEVDQAI
ncbi:MAG: hypothetical protein M3270_00350 [Thermoproteota archaeon]|nr:hypothetical protein [Thermoproteota archaeon]